jgi:hypothetical protein
MFLTDVVTQPDLSRFFLRRVLHKSLRPSVRAGAGATLGGLVVAAITLAHLPGLALDLRRVLVSAPQLGPIMRTFLAPLLLASLLLLPLVALIAGAADGATFCSRERGLLKRWITFARVARSSAAQTVASTLRDGQQLGLPF